MKGKTKIETGIHAFLNASGLFEHGANEDIELAKKQYWKDYKKRWNKERQKTTKSFEIVFKLTEFRFIANEAEKYHTSPTNYIKQAALSNKRGIVDPVVVGEIRELIILHHTLVKSLTDENTLPLQAGNRLLEQISQIEEKLFDFFSMLKG